MTLCPITGATYSVMGAGQSHTISLTNENLSNAFSEKQRQVTPGSRSRKSSSSTSSSNPSAVSSPHVNSRSRTSSFASSSTSSSLSSEYSHTSNLSSPSSWSLSPNAIRLEGSRDAYPAPQNFSIPLAHPTQGVSYHARYIEPRPAMQHYDPSLSLPTSSLQDGNFTNYHEGNLGLSFPPAGVNQFNNARYSREFEQPLYQHESLSDALDSTINPNLINMFPDYNVPLMDQPVVPISRAPTSSSISSGGQPYYAQELMYPEQQQIQHTMSSNAIYMHNQQNFNTYPHVQEESYEDFSMLTSDPNTPKPSHYDCRN